MGDLSDFLANELLDHVLRNASYTAPSAIYLGLSTNGSSEISGNGYARVACTFDVAATSATTSSAAVTFGVPTASWGTISHCALFDALSSGNRLTDWKALTASKTVAAWDTLTFAAGDIDWTF